MEGIKLIGRYGGNAKHTMFFIVETDDVNAIQTFLFRGFKRCSALFRGFKRCSATVTPVSEVPVPRA